MKVTLAANHGDIGGGEVMLFAIAEQLRAIGRAVQVVAPASPSVVADQALALGFPVVTIHGEGTRRYLSGLRRWDARERTGLLWANGLRPALATAGHRRRIVHLHQIPHGAQIFAARVASQGARRVLVPSVAMRQAIGWESTVLENWTQQVTPAPPLHWPDAQITLGFLGRPSMDKGIGVLADALRILQDRQPGRYRLLIGGEPRFVSEAAQREVESALHPVRHLVDRPGWMTREGFFGAVDVAVVPSIAPESFGLVVAEAMSAGVPCVVSDVAALREVAGPDHPWVARAGDAESLADEIGRAAGTDPSRLEAARRRWASEFSPEAGAQRIASLMTELAEEELR